LRYLLTVPAEETDPDLQELRNEIDYEEMMQEVGEKMGITQEDLARLQASRMDQA